MSSRELSAYIKRRILPIIRKDIRDKLDTAEQSLEIPVNDLADAMVDVWESTGMTKSIAVEILNKAIKSLDADNRFERAETSRPNVWVTKGFAPGAKVGAKTVKTRYGQFDSWKRGFSNKLIKDPKYKDIFSGIPFSTGLQLGHGATPELSIGRQSKTLASVEQRRVRAFGNVQGTKQISLEDKQKVVDLLGTFGEEKILEEIDFQVVLDNLYTVNGEIKRTGKVFLTLQTSKQNQAERALEVAFQTRLEKELEGLADAKSSPSPMEYLDKYYDDLIIHGKKSKGLKSGAKFQETIKGKAKSKKGKIKKVAPMRTAKGQFTSPIALMNLINARLHDVIRKNMGSPRLNYQTGRFARSVKITNISQTRQQQMTAFYTYMKSPYQTFERGYAQGSTARDPRSLISKSIRDAAAQIMGSRFDIRTRRQ